MSQPLFPDLPNPEAIAGLLASRRTIHDFQPDPVPPREQVLKALELARWAPNHKLTEPWRFYLLGRQSAEAIAQLNARRITQAQGQAAGQAKLERWLKVPGWLVATCRNSDDPIQAREDYAACCCAMQNAMLYLWGQGIGMKWTTGAVIRDAEFHDLIWVDPQVETVVGLFWYGYPREVPQVSRQPLEEVMVELP